MRYNAPGIRCRCCGDMRVNRGVVCVCLYQQFISLYSKVQHDAVKNRSKIDQEAIVTTVIVSEFPR